MTCRPHYWVSTDRAVRCGKCGATVAYQDVDANLSRSIEAAMRVQLDRRSFAVFQNKHRAALATGWATS